MVSTSTLFLLSSLLHSAEGLAQHHANRPGRDLDVMGNHEEFPNVTGEMLWQNLIHGQFPNVTGKSLWAKCTRTHSIGGFKPVEPESCLHANLILIRVFKTGTSSLSSALLRVAARYGLNGIGEKEPEGMPEPVVSITHFPRSTWSQEPFIKKQGKFEKPNILITMLRDPVERWLSDFYYRATKGKEDNDLMKYLKDVPFKEKNFNFELGYLRKDDSQKSIEDVLHSYPLVGLQERFDDTLTAFMYMMGLNSYCDVLFVNSKISSSGESKKGVEWLEHIPLAEQPAEVKDFLASDEFQHVISQDLELVRLANRRMDNMIEKIGKARFEKRRSGLRAWLDKAQSTCDDGESGFDASCYYSDLGCAHKCLDHFCDAQSSKLRVADPDTPMFMSDDIFKAPLFQTAEE